MNRPSSDWQIVLSRHAEHDLVRLPKPMRQRISAVIDEFRTNPWPVESRKLVSHEDTYRVRIGDYRVVYGVDAANQLIIIYRISPRGSAYESLN